MAFLFGSGSVLCVTSFDFVFCFCLLERRTWRGHFTVGLRKYQGSVRSGLVWDGPYLWAIMLSFLFVSFFSSVQGLASFGWVLEAYSSL